LRKSVLSYRAPTFDDDGKVIAPSAAVNSDGLSRKILVF
jgi:hypothetical protein